MEDTMEQDRITLRVPTHMRQEWEERAKRQGRPMANWIRWMLEKCKDMD